MPNVLFISRDGVHVSMHFVMLGSPDWWIPTERLGGSMMAEFDCPPVSTPHALSRRFVRVGGPYTYPMLFMEGKP